MSKDDTGLSVCSDSADDKGRAEKSLLGWTEFGGHQYLGGINNKVKIFPNFWPKKGRKRIRRGKKMMLR